MIIISIFLVLLHASSIQLQAINEEGMGLGWGMCPLMVKTKMTWQDAQKHCESRNARLFTPFILRYKVFFTAYNQINPNEISWAGFSRQSSTSGFEWDRAYEQDPFSANVNATSSTGNCGAMSFSSGDVVFLSRNCNELRTFFCEKYQDSTHMAFNYNEISPLRPFYLRIDEKLTYSEAHKFCAIFDATLPTIIQNDYVTENDYLFEQVRTTTRSTYAYWLGAQRIDNDNEWKWLDSKPISTTFTNFMSNYTAPTASEGNSRLVMWSNQARVVNPDRVQGTWGHQDADTKQGVICMKRYKAFTC